MSPTAAAHRPWALRVLFSIPVLGWALECLLVDDRDEAKLLGLGVLLMAWVLAVMMFGFGALIYTLHALVLVAFVFMLTLTRA